MGLTLYMILVQYVIEGLGNFNVTHKSRTTPRCDGVLSTISVLLRGNVPYMNELGKRAL